MTRTRTAARATLRPLDPTRIGVLLSSINVVILSLMALAQWAAWGGWHTAARLAAWASAGEALGVAGVNLAYGLLIVGATFSLRPMRWPARALYPFIAAVALVASLPRVGALHAIYSTPSGWVFLVAEWVSGFAAGFLAVGAGVLTAQFVIRARDEEIRRLHAQQRAARAVEDLQTEELRVRRMVSDQLHGTLQYQLVTVTAGLDGLAARLAAGDPTTSAELRDLTERLEEIREQEVRSLSHAVFPSGVDLGTARAVEQLLHRLPPQIATSLDVGPGYRRLAGDGNPLPLAERLVVVYAVEEGVTNALKHGRATTVHVAIDARQAGDTWVLDVDVDDDGTGVPDPQPAHHGLVRHAGRIESRGGTLDLGPGPLGGARLHLTLPFDPDKDRALGQAG
ncbi:hypothetical protein ET495_13560 [Xylanimonas allomyrinae]|uniref:Histidine kinase/HSP90-like ATPase domain-containing protein n=1 Tax=Xylanimonas allomyrinae TaxID=2509459 RepID=A0A4P6EUG4_9MICO|nr:hypothetical protein [Xylanimonas allomyrinae]QAY64077.1 hypothetical protein ET495_13560 [Xylanimonas allomyrinae]